MATEERRSWRGPGGHGVKRSPIQGRQWWRPKHAQVPGTLCRMSSTPVTSSLSEMGGQQDPRPLQGSPWHTDHAGHGTWSRALRPTSRRQKGNNYSVQQTEAAGGY